MSVPVIYMAHPVSGDIGANIARAKRWLRWCLQAFPHLAFIAPWISHVEVMDDASEAQRNRGLRDDVEVVKRCDQMWLVGGTISGGMFTEALARWNRSDEVAGIDVPPAKAAVLDLTSLGAEPPARMTAEYLRNLWEKHARRWTP